MSWSDSTDLDISLQFSVTACPFYFSEMRDYSTTDEEYNKAGLKIG